MSALPQSGPLRQLFLQSLLEFSDSCESPTENANCPYSVEMSSGRQCAEECMDVLAEHGPVFAVEELSLGDGLVARRRRKRRPRRPVSEHGKAFDAVEISAVDQHLPPNECRLTTLLKRFDDVITVPPTGAERQRAERLMLLQSLLCEIATRGIEPEEFVRTVACRRITSSMITGIGLAVVLGGRDDIDYTEELLELQPWKELIEVGAETRDLSPPTALSRIWRMSPIVMGTLETLTIEDILQWNPPKSLSESPSRSAGLELNWLFERFTETYLDGWSLDSLMMEWRYLHGSTPGACNAEFMRERHVDPDALAKAITERTVDRYDREKQGVNTAEHVAKAIEMLRDGRRVAAAAIFESIAEIQPNDAHAFNNWGFCLIPDQPDVALPLLQQAATLGLDSLGTNVGNRVLCLSLIDRTASALSLAERFWSTVPAALTREPGFMWERTSPGGDFEIAEVRDCSHYVASLAAELAHTAGDPTLADQWRERAASLDSARISDR